MAGRNAAFKRICGRERPAFKSPEKLVEEMAIIDEYIRGPIFLLGDFRQAGEKYAIELLRSIQREKIANSIVFELFAPISEEFLRTMSKACTQFSIEISPETHDEKIRKLQGRAYLNKDLEATLRKAIDYDCRKIDVFFMTGLAGQSAQSVMETVQYCAKLLKEYGGDGRMHPFISPLAPFLDPGSLAFENPKGFGYHLFYRSLKDHVSAMTMPTWKYFLNYSTFWMSRDDVVEATYTSALALNSLKSEFGLLGDDDTSRINQRISEHRDAVRTTNDMRLGDSRYVLPTTLEQVRLSFLCNKHELRSPIEANVKILGVLKQVVAMLARSKKETYEESQ